MKKEECALFTIDASDCTGDGYLYFTMTDD